LFFIPKYPKNKELSDNLTLLQQYKIGSNYNCMIGEVRGTFLQLWLASQKSMGVSLRLRNIDGSEVF